MFFKSLLTQCSNLLPSVLIIFLQELCVSVALGICNQVEFIVLRQGNSIFEHTGNFFDDIFDSLDGWKFTDFAWKNVAM
jgi:hypothetical protein